MPIAKPAGHIEWVEDENPTKAQEPTAPKKALGFVADERPSPLFHNWLWARLGNWQKYFESATDELLAANLNYDAIVGAAAGATHATLQDAIDDAGSGWRILVLDDETVNTRIGVNISDIEIDFKPGVTFTKGSDTVGLEISGARVKIKNGRFVGFTTGGDIALKFVSGGDYGLVFGTGFGVGTDTEVDDAGVTVGKKPVVLGTQTEI